MSQADLKALCAFLDGSPTPAHAVQRTQRILADAGFTEQSPLEPFGFEPRSFVRRDGSLIAWTYGPGTDAAAPFRIVGAHTDSPGFRIKPRPVTLGADCTTLGVEVYGGPLLNSWLDRDLGIAGTVLAGSPERPGIRMVRDDRAVLRIPQLAVHLDRGVNENGLKLDRQRHLRPLWSIEEESPEAFTAYIAQLADTDPAEILGWELAPFDLAPAQVGGRNDELLMSARLDDLLSCHAALQALIAAEPTGDVVSVAVLVDHEEVGSSSTTGAHSRWISQVCERITEALRGDRSHHLRALADSYAVSVDMAHATHPNYPDRHDPSHPIVMNGGPVIKHNAQQRYATSLSSMAPYLAACDAARVPIQHFVSHSEMPCGSTIGPALATGLGIPVVDVGVAQLAMHSVREVCGSADPALLTWSLHQFLSAR